MNVFARIQLCIITDEWRAYSRIHQLGRNYRDLTVNHSLNFVDPQTGAYTQTVEREWIAAKAENRRRWGTPRHTLESYLCEFMWRMRLRAADPFEAILFDIALFSPPI